MREANSMKLTWYRVSFSDGTADGDIFQDMILLIWRMKELFWCEGLSRVSTEDTSIKHSNASREILVALKIVKLTESRSGDLNSE
jgi:hypothetical protein